MTLLAVEDVPVLRLISKAAEIDPDGTHELVRLALYELLCAQIDDARTSLESDLELHIAKRESLERQAVVKAYLEARVSKQDVDELVSYAKAIGQDDPKTRWWDARDLLGRFTRASTSGNQMATAYTGSKLQDTDDPFDKPRYSALRATGAALSTLNDSDAKLVGGAATALGALGPEAEKVLGQGLRRTAYRYRGTEKRPDKGLKRDIKSGLAAISGGEAAAALLRADADAESRGRQLAGKPFDKDRSSVRSAAGVSPSVAVAAYYGKLRNRLSDDQLEMRVAGDLAANYYLDKLPSEEQTRISIAAGAVPPSQGVIIDADGDVVSEAMGVNGDHYLPFDLKNLRSLQGGQYVRTRATGGPTTEDIYTGLLAGARQIQVVSQSGVFTVEFDPDLRGGRRYSDKARQMIKRYQRLLDAVDAGPAANLYQHDLDPAEVRAIRQKVAREFTDPKDAKTVGDRLINEARQAKSFSMLTDEEIDAEARRRLAKETDPPRQRLQELRNEVKDESRRDSVKAFRLDGDGYEAALKALKQEFPYYIRTTKREPLPEFVERRGLNSQTKYSSAQDRGYVSPRNATSGLADSVTVERNGTMVQRGPFKAAERRTAETPTAASPEPQTGSEGAPTAPAARPTQVLDDATVARAIDRHAPSLNLAAKYMGVSRDDQAALQDDSEYKLLPLSNVMFEVHAQAAESRKPFSAYLAGQGPEERAAYIEALDSLNKLLDDSNIPEPDLDRVLDSAAEVSAVLKAATPFPTGNPLEYDPVAHNNLPLAYPGVVKLGTDLEAYDKAESHLAAENPKVHDLIRTFREVGNEQAATTISEYLDDYAQAKNEEDKHRAEESLRAAQAAYSFVRAKDNAAILAKLMGGGSGKAPAPSAGAAPQPKQPVRKRLTWHPVGSQVATEFSKFLAARR